MKELEHKKLAEKALEVNDLPPPLLTRSGAAVSSQTERLKTEIAEKERYLNMREKEIEAREKKFKESEDRSKRLLLNRERLCW